MTTSESRFMEPLRLAGRIIMENGGETYRVEETITRMGRAFGLQNVESFAVPSGVFVSFLKSDGDTETAVVRVHKKGTDLMRVNSVNAVSRDVEAGLLSCDEAVARLQEIDRSPGLAFHHCVLCALVCGGGFTLMFGGSLLECLIAGLSAAAALCLAHLMEKQRMQAMAGTMLGAFLSALIPMLFHQWTGFGTVDIMVGAALMPLLPGLAMTNAVQDTMRGDMISGLSHGITAILTAGLIAFGVLVASGLCALLPGGGV